MDSISFLSFFLSLNFFQFYSLLKNEKFLSDKLCCFLSAGSSGGREGRETCLSGRNTHLSSCTFGFSATHTNTRTHTHTHTLTHRAFQSFSATSFNTFPMAMVFPARDTKKENSRTFHARARQNHFELTYICVYTHHTVVYTVQGKNS